MHSAPLAHVRFHTRSLLLLIAAIFTCSLFVALPVRGNGYAAVGGSNAIFLPMAQSGVVARSAVEVTLHLTSDPVLGRGDRVRLDVAVRNTGNVPLTNITLSTPFDGTRLTFFTYHIDERGGDQFLGVRRGSIVDLLVGRTIQPNRTASVALWFVIGPTANSGDGISMRTNYSVGAISGTSNRVRFYVAAPGVVGSCAPFRGVDGRMAVRPDRGPAGTTFLFQSDCFIPGETVITWLNTPSGVQQLPLTARADADGQITFTLSSRNFAVADTYGFVATGQRSDIQVLGPFIVTAAGQAALAEPIAPLTVPQTLATSNFQTVLAAATPQVGGVITGRVTGNGGAFLPDVSIFVFDVAGGLAGSALTDATGVYTTTALVGGSYSVRFDPQYALDPFVAAHSGTTLTGITVTSPSVTANVDAALALAADQHQISGRVTGADTGAGLADISVVVSNQATGEFFDGATTDDDGMYRVGNLPAGVYRIRFLNIRPDVPASLAYLDADYPAPIDLTLPAVKTGVNIALARGAQIGGIVRASGGVGLANVVIVITNVAGAAIDTTTTDDQGAYISTGLPDGAYQVAFETEGVPFPTSNYSRTTAAVTVALPQAALVTLDALLQRNTRGNTFLPLITQPAE